MIGTRGLACLDGGVEKAVSALAHQLGGMGHEVTVYGRRTYTADISPRYPNVIETILPHLSGKHTEAATHSAIAAIHAAANNDVDLVHFHAVGPTAFSFIPRLRGIPTVATIHALDWKRAKWSPAARLMLKAAAEMAVRVPDKTIAVSKYIAEHLESQPGVSVEFISNGVEFDPTIVPKAVPELTDRRFFLFLGRLVPEKGVHTLIEAFRLTSGDSVLALAGSESHTNSYRDTLLALAGDDPRIIFLGSRYGEEKAWLLQNCLRFVQPSTLEGLPISLLEAIAHGASTIVSDIPPHSEVLAVAGKQAAAIFAAGDSYLLSRLLERALEDGPLVDTAGMQRVRASYDWATVARETERVYFEALSVKSARHGPPRSTDAGVHS